MTDQSVTLFPGDTLAITVSTGTPADPPGDPSAGADPNAPTTDPTAGPATPDAGQAAPAGSVDTIPASLGGAVAETPDAQSVGETS